MAATRPTRGDTLQSSLADLHPLLDDLSRITNPEVIPHDQLMGALDSVRFQVDNYKKGKSSKERKASDDNDRERYKIDLRIQNEMDEIGVKIWNMTTELERMFGKKMKENERLIASLRHTSFRLLEVSTDPKQHLRLVIRLLRAASEAVSSLAQADQMATAEELALLGAEYHHTISSSSSNAPDEIEEAEKTHAILYFLLARVDLEISKKNDNLALSFMVKASNLDLDGTMDPLECQEMAIKCWSIAQELRSRQKATKAVSFTTSPIEWLQQGLVIIEKVKERSAHAYVLNKIRTTILQTIAQAHLKNASDDQHALQDAIESLEAIIKMADPMDQRTATPIRLLQIHLLSKRTITNDHATVRKAFEELLKSTKWSEETVSDPEIPVNLAQIILHHALAQDEGRPHVSRIVYEGVFLARQCAVAQPQAGYNGVLSMLDSVVMNGSERLLDRTRIMAIQMASSNMAGKAYESKGRFEDAARWFLSASRPSGSSSGTPLGQSRDNDSLQKVGPTRDGQINAHLAHGRKAALCYIRSGDLTSAEKEIAQCPAGEASTQHLAFLIAEKRDDIDKAKAAIINMIACQDVQPSQILLITSLAEKKGSKKLLFAALQTLFNVLQRPDLKEGFKVESLTVIRSMIRITRLQFDGTAEKDVLGETVVGLLDSAIALFRQSPQEYRSQVKSISWLFRIAYNVAVEQLANLSAKVLSDLFDRSAQLIDWYRDFNPAGLDSDLEKIRASAMFSCFCGKTFQYRDLPESEEKLLLRTQLTQYFTIVKQALPRDEEGKSNKMRDLLEVYHIELLCDASNWELIGELIATFKSTNLADSDRSIRKLEMVVNLLLDHPGCPPRPLHTVIHDTLDTIIKTCVITNETEVVRFSRWIRGIMMILLPKNGRAEQITVKSYLSRVHKVLQTALGSQNYPHDEMQWLIATTWNRGLDDHRNSRLNDARSWFGLCLKLADCMPEGVINMPSLIIGHAAGNSSPVETLRGETSSGVIRLKL
nr:uncharacterized protein I203_04285 [Kwoniella mangroviensis CBS 8507]OCF66709.1 hypothetical protein I203_04285 [Kwoniella mangroviensis CBS 8507]